jgi:cupin fold WbuC family metalloprotein
MRLKKTSEEVLYVDEPVVKFDLRDIDYLKKQSLLNPRQRLRFCAHRNVSSDLHEMMIVHQKEAYVRPHKHLGKIESMHIVEGIVDVALFDDEGKITDVIEMGDYSSGRKFYYRISDPVYHTLLICSDVLVFHETVNGPFSRDTMVFAPWSPDEKENPKAAAEYAKLLTKETAKLKREIEHG